MDGSGPRTNHHLHVRRAAGGRVPARPQARDGRAEARGLDGAKVLDLGIYIIISALIGAKLLLLVTDFRVFQADPRELLTLARSGGVFYGGLILAVAVALWYIRRAGLPLWTTCDAFAPGIALGHVVGRFGCFFAGCCYGKPTTRALGHHVHGSVRGCQRRNASRRPAASDAALRGGRRIAHSDDSPRDGTKGTPVRRANVLALHAAVCDLAVHHRVLSRRPARIGRHVLDLAVHLDHPGASGHRDARAPVACDDARAEARRKAA